MPEKCLCDLFSFILFLKIGGGWLRRCEWASDGLRVADLTHRFERAGSKYP